MANRFVLNNISYHGAGAIQEIPGEITRREFSKVFVATDADLVRFGVTKKVTDVLDEAGIAWEMFSDIKPNPTIENVQAGVAAFKASGADCIVAVGDGSSDVLLRFSQEDGTLELLFCWDPETGTFRSAPA